VYVKDESSNYKMKKPMLSLLRKDMFYSSPRIISIIQHKILLKTQLTRLSVTTATPRRYHGNLEGDNSNRSHAPVSNVVTPSSNTKRTTNTSTTPKGKFKVYSIAEGKNKYGPREYHLMPLELLESTVDRGRNVILSRQEINEFRVASLYANKNVLIGAWCQQPYCLVETCAPLVDKAMKHAESNGEQVQALAALHGLCQWVNECISRDGEGSVVLSDFIRKEGDAIDPLLPLLNAISSGSAQAVRSVFDNEETYGRVLSVWDKLVREFCAQRKLAKEVELYRAKGAVLVDIIPMAENSDTYLASAGGSMVRMYFVS
jgi:hypothetical protein